MKRRTILAGGISGLGLVLLPSGRARASLAYPFTLGIASGDPTPDGVVLWTRLAVSPLNPDGFGGMPGVAVPVDWEVATDEAFSQLVATGTAMAQPASAHTVHVEVVGLQSGAWYFYRFRADGHISPVGRTRTAPALDSTGGPLTILATSCADYQRGYYTVYRRMAEENPDLVLFLGDYIYEGYAAGSLRPHTPTREAATLADYRLRHAQYKTDPDLQAAHAGAPWLPVWDDHEVENNYAGFVRADSSPPGDFTARRAAAYRAYYEHMPLRAAQVPVGATLPLYRRVPWGRLATFHLLDTRQYRDDQACGDGIKVCPDALSPTRTITGLQQEAWLLNGLSEHRATWDLIGQQVFFAQQLWSDDRAMAMDGWDGYAANRDRLQRGWYARGVRNAVVLTGDVHRAYANNLMLDYDRQDTIVGTELVTSSVSSGGDGDPADTSGLSPRNPHVRFYSNLRGYIRATVESDHLTADFRAVDRITITDQPVRTLRSYGVAAGQPGLNDA